jgi:nicotinate-nucleotide adenylyltransferase
VQAAERIGIFGGTFDPPHVGHLTAAVNVRHDLRLDRVLMVPAAIPWQKAHLRAISAPEHRLAMARAAFGGVDGLEVATLELDRGGESYSADTLEALQAGSPDAALFLVVGSDIAPTLDTWKRPDVLRALATIVIYERPGSPGRTPPPGWDWQAVAVPQIPVSSTDVRARVRHGRPIDGLVAREVVEMIRGRGLYAATSVEVAP